MGSFNELNKLVVTILKPLEAVRARESRPKGERRAGGVEVEDRSGGG